MFIYTFPYARIDIIYKMYKSLNNYFRNSCVIVSGLLGRHEDFSDGILDECYVVHNSKAVVVNSANFSSPDKAAIKQIISEIIEKLRT